MNKPDSINSSKTNVLSRCLALSGLLVQICGSCASEPSAADIENIAEQARIEERARGRQLKVAQPDDLLDWVRTISQQQTPESTPDAKPSRITELKSNKQVPVQAQPRAITKPVAANAEAANKPRLKPTRTAHSYQVVSVDFAKAKTSYGIDFDHWIEAELRQPLTSRDRAPIKLYSSQAVSGRDNTLPAGAIFVGSHSYDSNTNRLFARIDKIYHPDGQIIEIRASIYDQEKNFGLPGTVINKIEHRIGHGRAVATNSLIDGLVDKALPGTESIAGHSLAAGARAMKSTRKQPDKPQSYLQVEPQTVLINVETGF